MLDLLNGTTTPAPFQAGVDYPLLSWGEAPAGTPAFTTDPAEKTIVKGEGVTLTAKAKTPDSPILGHDGTITYAWYTNTTGTANPKSDDNPTGDEPIATGASVADGMAKLETTPTIADDAELPATVYYYCVATNAYKESDEADAATVTKQAISKVAPVHVTSATPAAKPTVALSAGSANITKNEGESATLSATTSYGDATTGIGETSFTWYVSDTSAANPGNDAVVTEGVATDGLSSTLTISNVQLGEHYYYCVATNTFEQYKKANSDASAIASVTGTGIVITTPAQLKTIADNVNNGTNLYEGKTITLGADIDLASDPDTEAWTPIGASTNNSFKGTFEGGGHVVSGLSVARGSNQYNGLFGYTYNATLRNFVVRGSGVSGASNTAGVAGMLAGTSASVYRVGNEVPVTSTGYEIGGIVGAVGASTTATISECYNKTNVTTSTSSGARAGGIVGRAYNAQVVSCYNTGTISCTATSNNWGIGGITGHGGKVSNCLSTGSVSAPGSYTGAITGESINIGADTFYVNADEIAYTANNADAAEITAAQLKGEANYNDAPFLNALNAGDYAGTWKAGTGTSPVQASPILSWEYTEGLPIITEDPADAEYDADVTGDQLVALQAKVSMPAGIGSDGTLTYQWYSNTTGTADPENDTKLGTAGTQLPAKTPGTVTCYYVVTNTYTGGENPSASATSALARVIVHSNTPAATPSFTQQPQDATAGQGETVALTAEATATGEGAGAISYQWYSCDGTDKANPVKIDGATGASFEPDTISTGTYYYYVEATNTFEGTKTASVESNVATFTVTGVQIRSQEDLAAVATAVNANTDSYEGKTLELANDIAITGSWTPVGSSSGYYNIYAFKGEFNGNGHTITFTPNAATTQYFALFGIVDGNAYLHDFIVDGSVSSSTSYVASVVAQARGSAKIENVGNKAAVTQTGSSGSYTAGILAYAYSSSVEVKSCYNKGAITSSYNSVAGICSYGSPIITSCYNKGVIKSTRSNTSSYSGTYVGGIVGNGSSAQIRNCVNAESASAPNDTSTYQGAISGSSMASVPATESDANYYLVTSATRPSYGTENAYNHAKTAAEIKALASTLNAGSYAGTWLAGSLIGQNSPILAWEKPAGSPIIAGVSDDINVLVDTTQTVSVTASAPLLGTGSDGTITYQWYSNTTGAVDTDVDTPIAGATAASYAVPTSTPGTTYYYCAVTNTFGDGDPTVITLPSAAVKVVLRDADPAVPVVAVTPGESTFKQRVAASDLAVSTFYTTDKGKGDETYQWYTCDADGSNAQAIEGATGATYKLSTKDMGTLYYACGVVNTYDEMPSVEVVSAPVSVTVVQLAITNAAELDAFAKAVNGGEDYSGATVLLGRDIDLADGTLQDYDVNGWTPIGNATTRIFKGVFDGQGHRVKNVQVDVTSGAAGLFGYVSGTGAKVSNFILDASSSINLRRATWAASWAA